jgi:hypothetical protein
MILQDASFRMIERFMIKAALFINGYSLKKRGNKEHDSLNHPCKAGLETLYAALLISTREAPFSSINALLKAFLMPAESCILKQHGYTMNNK